MNEDSPLSPKIEYKSNELLTVKIQFLAMFLLFGYKQLLCLMVEDSTEE